ncbi:MAG: T9SS type A sorting domain-containing protein [Bacteroidetes bacterium]|nr:T9SS type A sorting domain-containing protein [Bacteroidota bacterium]
MKKILPLFILLLCHAWLGAQITVTNATFPALGDTLRLATDHSPGGINALTPPGGNQAWDFSSLQADLTQQIVYKAATEGSASSSFPAADLFVAFDDGTEAYFNVTTTNFERLATLGPDPAGIGMTLLNVFTPPHIERKAPLAFFDINQQSQGMLLRLHPTEFPAAFLQSLPVTPDSLRFRVAWNTLEVVDAWGTLTIPNGNFDVLRAKRTEYRESRLDAKVPPLGWLDITDVAIQTGLASGLGVDTTVAYHFYNNVAKEPIAVVTLDNAQSQATQAVYKNIGPTTGVGSPNPSAPAWTLFPNPTTEAVYFDGKHIMPGDYALQIIGTNGTVVLSKTLSGTESVDVSKLAVGNYFYRIADQGGKVLGTGSFQKQ